MFCYSCNQSVDIINQIRPTCVFSTTDYMYILWFLGLFCLLEPKSIYVWLVALLNRDLRKHTYISAGMLSRIQEQVPLMSQLTA